MLKRVGKTEYVDCGCGCGKYAEPPKSCKVCEHGWEGVWDGVTCGLLNEKVGIYYFANKACPNRGKRLDCPIRERHSDGLRYE